MPEVEIGAQRLFEAVQVRFNVPDDAQVLVSKGLGDGTTIHIAIGRQPRVGGMQILLPNAGLVPVDATGRAQASMQYLPQQAEQQPIVVEVTASKMIEISQTLYDAVAKNTKRGNQRLRNRCEREKGILPELATIFAGFVGLRMHKQLVMKSVEQNLLVRRSDGRWKTFGFEFIGEAVWETVLGTEAVGIAMQPIEQGMMIQDRLISERVLTWLLRGWQERVPLFKFLAFFLALEKMTVPFGGKITVSPPTEAREIQTLIQKYAGERARDLQKFFARNVTQPREAKDSLQIRFERLAAEANFPTKRADIAAFAIYKKMRDDLMHEGKDDVKLSVPIEINGTSYMIEIEELAVRYLNWLHFHDHRHYSENEIPVPQPASESDALDDPSL